MGNMTFGSPVPHSLSAGYEKVPWKENDYAVNLNEMEVLKVAIHLLL
jgi:hypothetical protein